MYPTRTRYRDSPYVRSIYEVTHSLEEKIPTFTRTLDRYFDAHFEDIIEEWQLLTDLDLHHLERKLDTVTKEIDNLYNEKTHIEGRVATLIKEIEDLEGGLNETR